LHLSTRSPISACTVPNEAVTNAKPLCLTSIETIEDLLVAVLIIGRISLNRRLDLDHSQMDLLIPLRVAVSLDDFGFILKVLQTDFDEGIRKVIMVGER
jgi:hypothetical protein